MVGTRTRVDPGRQNELDPVVLADGKSTVRPRRSPSKSAEGIPIRTYTSKRSPQPMRSQPKGEPSPQGMLRKNITITPEEEAFLERHPEINQSALFRQIVESLMLAERSPSVASTQQVRLGKAVYRSGAIMFQKPNEKKL